MIDVKNVHFKKSFTAKIEQLKKHYCMGSWNIQRNCRRSGFRSEGISDLCLT